MEDSVDLLKYNTNMNVYPTSETMPILQGSQISNDKLENSLKFGRW